MPRRREVKKREILPDSKYKSLIVAKLVNRLMLDGKKSVAERVVYGCFDVIEKKVGSDPVEVLTKALSNVRPALEVKSQRVGGATYQVPREIRSERSEALSLRWVISYARGRSEKTMIERLANELVDAYNNRGGAVKKKEDTHRMADANKAFAHYRW